VRGEIPEPLKHRVGGAIAVLYVDETKFLYKNLLNDRCKLFMLADGYWTFVADWTSSAPRVRAMLILCEALGIAVEPPSEK